ncbi:MAG: flagellar hook protein FlgE [Armatimonadota bacterium]
MIQAMYNGVAGLKAHKTEMDVISNNIANINTTGYKGSRVSFSEMLSQTIQGAGAPSGNLGGTNPQQIGLGVGIGSIDVNQTQGSLVSTGKSTDVAIDGSGYLILGDGQGKYYTRDGAFSLDADGSLVASSSGLKVLGWTADPITGNIDTTSTITAASGIKLPVGQLAVARETANVSLGGNLNSESAAGTTCDVSFDVYDSLGSTHPLKVTFTKTANAGEWTWNATSADATGVVGSGTINFNTKGACLNNSSNVTLTLATPGGADSAIDMSLNFQAMTQLSGDPTAKLLSQDGLPLGELSDFTIASDGVITGTFDNGMTQVLAKLALAQFSNSAGLSQAGNNKLVETGNSGLPQVGGASDGSFGSITAGYLESSNVDLSSEFANMIVAQRGFQANSRIITTSDELLQELVQLKR